MRRQVIETMRRAKRLRHRAGILGRAHAICLLYHRIATPSSDPWDLSVSPQHFGEHLNVLRQIADCCSFGDLVPALDRPDRARRMAAITFDDGYRDNLEAAAPLLEAHQVPATVFVVSSMIGVPREFWWDAISRALLTTLQVPEMLELETTTGTRHWNLGRAATCTPEDLRRLSQARLPFDLSLHPRMRLLDEVRQVLMGTSPQEAAHLVRVVLDWSGLEPEGDHGDQPMTETEIQRLADSGLIEIGAHTVSHRPLDLLSAEETRDELAGSRAALRDIVGKEITTFAYPFGRFGAATPRIAAEVGFSAACTTWEYVAVGKIDPFRFPRITVRDCDGDSFARMLRDYVGR